MKSIISLIIIFAMATLLSCTPKKDMPPADTVPTTTIDMPNSETDMLPNSETDIFPIGTVQLISYMFDGTDKAEWFKHMTVILKKDKEVELEIRFDDAEFWNFKLTNLQTKNNTLTGDLHNSMSMDSCPNGTSYPNECWGYYVDNARGAFTFDRNTSIATLDFYFSADYSENHYVIRWHPLPAQSK